MCWWSVANAPGSDSICSADLVNFIQSYPTHQASVISGFLGLAVLLIATILLLRHNKQGRWLLLLGIVLLLLQALLTGPNVRLRWHLLSEDMEFIILGVVSVLIWSDPIKKLFPECLRM